MTTIKLLGKIITVVLFSTLLVFAAKKTVTFEVKGSCKNFETRIESKALEQEGVVSADWTMEDNLLKLKYNSKLTSAEELQKAIVGKCHMSDGKCQKTDKDGCKSGSCDKKMHASGDMASSDKACAKTDKDGCKSGSCHKMEQVSSDMKNDESLNDNQKCSQQKSPNRSEKCKGKEHK
jgi:hypothetical protein